MAKSKEVDDIKTKRGTMNNLQSFKKITHRLSYGNGPLKLSWFGLFPSCVLYGTILTSSASCSFGLMTSPTDSQAPMTLPGRGEGKDREEEEEGRAQEKRKGGIRAGEKDERIGDDRRTERGWWRRWGREGVGNRGRRERCLRGIKREGEERKEEREGWGGGR